MIECHPLLRPIVHLAQPLVHAVRSWHPRIHHHIHRLLAGATPPQAVMTVCQRVAGPIVAGGLVLLPPASAVPPAGGVGGFPGAIVPEYGAPAFGPGFANGGSPGTYGPSGYGPAALGLGGIAPGILVPSSTTPGPSTPTVIASNTPVAAGNSPGTSVPETPVFLTTDNNVPVPGSGMSPGLSTPDIPPSNTPLTPNTTPPPNTPLTPNMPPSSTPPPPGNSPGTPTPPGTGQNGSPGNDTPVNTPEPASIAVLASGLALVVLSRALWTRRARR